AVVFGLYHFMGWVSPETIESISSLPWLITTYAICFIASFSIYPSIIQTRLVKWESVASRIISTCSMMLLFISLVTLITHSQESVSLLFLFLSILVYGLFLLGERSILRIIIKNLRANNHNQKSVVLIGNEPTMYELYKILDNPEYGYNIAGVFYDGECSQKGFKDLRLGSVGDIYGWLATHEGINEIYGYFPKEQQETINMISKFCDNHLIRFFYIPAIDVFKGSMTVSFKENIPIIARREEPLRSTWNQFAKRIFDLFFSGLVLLLVFPWIYILVAIFIKIQSPGPVFFKQERTGLDGKVFKCFKFRSMKVNKDADKIQATKDDPRKFPFGNLMRKTNIDELPQFINVFLGDMSVVGPRPHMLKHTEEYSKLINRFMVRHLAKPGITGLAQVSGFRGETKYIDQMEGRVKKDIEYIENWTFWLDIKIIIKTVTNMLGREKGNAY
ncbi:MAG: undecaprenyl-phosphate glucose phosphotransferase, partial [Bacteroidaceae bacterium]|nr:undecaprenyl-phosphate glucose phosphotransferase [Bacteroidaceae bacterium]